MFKKMLLLAVVSCAAACSAQTTDEGTTGDVAEVNSDVQLDLTSDFKTKVSGRAKAGSALLVNYALDRLPQCRGNVGGGGPGWNIAGYYSENGGPAKTFEVTTLTPDGKDRVAKPARIVPKTGGDLALWFEVNSAFGCHEYDSQFGQNYHVDVEGLPPDAGASIVFGADGKIETTGTLRAGSKVKIRYEQDRLPECRRVQNGIPQWSISGFASIAGGEPQSFGTGRPDGADREEVDAYIELPKSGDLALWFGVNDVGGCHAFDSKNGQNYHFTIE